MFKTVIIILIAILFLFGFYSNNIENFSNNQIPMVIIQTWKDRNIPDKYKDCIASVRKYNKNFKYIFMTDKDIEDFLIKNYRKYYETYRRLPVKIQKIDFFRYIVVYHYGGFYLDLDMTVLKPFDGLLKDSCVFPVDQHISRKCNFRRYKIFCEKGMDILVGQYAFGARRGDSFIKKLVDGIHENIGEIEDMYRKLDRKGDAYKRYVYDTTGPDYVTRKYMEDKRDVKILGSDRDQYFGNYAAHNYFGTWK